MAPPSGAAKGRSRPGSRVVPVIPLPALKRQAAAVAAKHAPQSATKGPAAPEPSASPTSKVDDEPAITQHPPPADPATASSESAPSETPAESESQTMDSTPASAAASLPVETKESINASVQVDPRLNGEEAGQTGSPSTLENHSGGWSGMKTTDVVSHPAPEATKSYGMDKGGQDVRNGVDAAYRSNAPACRPLVPPFQPSHQQPPPGFETNCDLHHGHHGPGPGVARNHRMHHAHPSSGSAVHFSAYSGSSAASPTPPHSGGMMPPPGIPLNGAQVPFVPAGANVFSPMAYGPDATMSGNGINGFAHPNMAYGGSQSYPPFVNGQEPSTPLHWQEHPDSQHSADILEHLKQQFMNPDWSDTLLELRFADGRPPVRIPGHRVIFAKSPALAELITRVDPHGNRRPVILDIDNKWVRSDSLWAAVQSLYGHPLLPIPPPSHNTNGMTQAGSTDQQLEYALSYTAAGQVLGYSPVMRRGCEIAAQLIHFDNLDRVLEFALEGHIDFGSHEVFKYQRGSEILLAGVASFIAANLTANFSINDTSADTQTPTLRLPIQPQPKSAKRTQSPSEAEQPNGVTDSPRASLARGHRRQLSSIKFGDMAGADGANGQNMNTPRASQARPAHQAALSRAILNIPFGFLRMVMDYFGSRLAASQGFIDPQQTILTDIVDARESERSRAIESLLGDGGQSRMNVINMLRAPEPRIFDQWGILGWEESVASAPPSANGGLAPLIQREWRPLWLPQRESEVAEFP